MMRGTLLCENWDMASIPLLGLRVTWGRNRPLLISRTAYKLTLYTRTNTHVALKILRSDCYDGNHDIFELEMLQHIEYKSSQSTRPGQNHVLPRLNHFRHEGDEGTHVCLVSPVSGHHLGLQTAKFEQSRIPVAVMKEVARQLLQGLDYLHQECHIIHTGKSPSSKPVLLPLRELIIGNQS